MTDLCEQLGGGWATVEWKVLERDGEMERKTTDENGVAFGNWIVLYRRFLKSTS